MNGNRFRPLLTYYGYTLYSNELNETIYHSATAIELIHKASIIIDDIIDQDEKRHGLPTVHQQYSINEALIITVFLLGKCIELLSNIDDSTIRLFSQMISKMCQGTLSELNKVYIRETTSYFVHNKEYSDKNQYIKGRTLIRQLTNDSQMIPYRRPTVESLQKKITEINLLIELTEIDKKYQDIKDELVVEIAELDIKLTQTNEKIATLNKMAEVLIKLKSDDLSSRKLAKYDFSKLNLTESITLEHVSEEIRVLQEELGHYLDEYEGLARRLETFVKLLNIGGKLNIKMQDNIYI
ncbi:TPA: helical hairpin domain-containing protein [Streptococcus suis]